MCPRLRESRHVLTREARGVRIPLPGYFVLIMALNFAQTYHNSRSSVILIASIQKVSTFKQIYMEFLLFQAIFFSGFSFKSA